MREIDFKGQRIDNNQWVYWYYMVDNNGDSIIIQDVKVNDIWLLSILGFKVIPETVWQYTWLRDKNKRKIYSWDTVKQYPDNIFTVKFKNWQFWLNQNTNYFLDTEILWNNDLLTNKE
jgi:hypothetical protein